MGSGLWDVPLKGGFIELTAGADTRQGPFADLKLGIRPLPPVSIFGFGHWTPGFAAAGVGVSARW